MKKISLLLPILLASTGLVAQENIVNLSMEANYSKNVYFHFESGNSESYDVASWDVAFIRTSPFLIAERVNDGLGIELYEASNDPDDYATIDPTNIDTWTRLYNSDSMWEMGAFDSGSAEYGWGGYNPVNHHVEGTVVFVLKYSNGDMKKFMIENFYNGYNFKYANWDTTTLSWGSDYFVNLPNSENPGKLFNYYSLTNNESVVASPDLDDWDLVFQTYVTDLGIMYPVVGALHNPNVKVAKSTNLDVSLLGESDYKEEINTVGYDWKSFGNGGYVVNSSMYYFLKNANGKIYRFHFLTYEGSASGDFSFAYEDVSGQMSTINFDDKNSLSIYPNPVRGKILNLLYESNGVQETTIQVYDLTGKVVAQEKLPINGFFNHQMNLSHLSKGVYILKFNSGNYSKTQKIIIE